jgi:dimethylargininase
MSHANISFRFSNAIVCQPGQSVARGLCAENRGQPDFRKFRQEHASYIDALEQAGLKVEVLPPQEQFPDSVFVEDAALCLPQGSIILRPGTPSRLGEADIMAASLARLGHETHPVLSDGFVDGGDILVTDSVILVGLSERTDRNGYESLKQILSDWGYRVRAVHTPEHVLHFKSDCCLLDSETILATSRLAESECFSSFKILTVPEGEEAAANSIRVNDVVLTPDGFPATAELLAREGYSPVILGVTQAALLDGGLSCMSLRF